MSLLQFLRIALFMTGLAVPLGQAQTFTVLYSFTGGTDGALPFAGLIQDPAGNLYGTTVGAEAGTTLGSVFKISPDGKFKLPHNFESGGAGGAEPAASLVLDGSGNLFGTTIVGGSSNDGIVFRLDEKNRFSVVYNFSGKADGAFPQGSLTLDPEGNLYGAAGGGASKCNAGTGCGVVFKLATGGNETILHSFSRPGFGDYPEGGILRDGAGNLYSTTGGGGQGGRGTLFKLDADGGETVLYAFQHEVDGVEPQELIWDSAGNFYGATVFGGTGNCQGRHCGVVFKVDPSGNETVLYTFKGKLDGGNPSGALVMDAAGNLYGTTFAGGEPSTCFGQGCGVVFKIDTSGRQTVLHSLSGGPDGAAPEAGLLIDSGGVLYGTASHGGNPNCNDAGCGVVFKITP